MKPVNAQPYHSRPPISRTVSGRIVATASASKAAIDTVSSSPIVSALRVAPSPGARMGREFELRATRPPEDEQGVPRRPCES